MSIDTNAPGNPEPSHFAGNTPGRAAKRLFHATRPKFFPASVLPVLAGTAWGIAQAGRFDVTVFLLALVATVCVHAASNVLNDVGDEEIGTDRRNETRIYPYTGGSRFIQTGILNAAQMFRLGSTLMLIAAICGLVLLIQKGHFVLWFGAAGVALGVLYSLGPVRLSSLGLGETAVAVAFGVLPVSGAAWLQGAALNADLLLFSLPVSAWVAAILLINEVPDIEADAASGKRTLPVRLGLNATAGTYLAIHLAAFLAVTWLTYKGSLPLVAPLLPLILLVLAVKASGAVRVGAADRPAMTKAIEMTLGIHTLGSLWLTGCMIFRFFWPST